MPSDSNQLRKPLLCRIDINAVLHGYRTDIALSTTTLTPQERYGNMVLLWRYQCDIALVHVWYHVDSVFHKRLTEKVKIGRIWPTYQRSTHAMSFFHCIGTARSLDICTEDEWSRRKVPFFFDVFAIEAISYRYSRSIVVTFDRVYHLRINVSMW